MPANNDQVVTITDEVLSHTVRKKKIAFVVDTGDGSLAAFNVSIKGWIFMVVTTPDTVTSPTPAYDITMLHPPSTGLDIMGGTLADRAETTPEQAFPLLFGTTYGARFVSGLLQILLVNNTELDAEGLIEIYYETE